MINKLPKWILLPCIFIALAMMGVESNHFSMGAPNEIHHSNDLNFNLIKEWVKDKRVVAIGESTHGLGEFFTTKSALIQYLHSELDYEVLAMEGGFGDINLAWSDIEKLSASDLVEKTLFGNFSCEEIAPLFTYIKNKSADSKALIYAGFDTQISGSYYEIYLDTICDFLKLAINIQEEFSAYAVMYQASFEPDSTNFIRYRDRYQDALEKIQDAVRENRSAIQKQFGLEELAIDIMLRSLDMQYKAVQYSFANRMNREYIPRGVEIRDSLMAENLFWLLDRFPDKKFIIWGHNSHIQKHGVLHMQTKWMGHYLKEVLGDDYFSIGLFAYKGKTYQHWTGETISFENTEEIAIENKMSKKGFKFSFQDFRNTASDHWTNQIVQALEIENGGPIQFIPSQRFDAGICIYESDIPTFIDR